MLPRIIFKNLKPEQVEKEQSGDERERERERVRESKIHAISSQKKERSHCVNRNMNSYIYINIYWWLMFK